MKCKINNFLQLLALAAVAEKINDDFLKSFYALVQDLKAFNDNAESFLSVEKVALPANLNGEMSKGEMLKLVMINLIANWLYENVMYVEDNIGYQKRDYFASPLETLINKYGDCEDFAIFIFVLAKCFNINGRLSYVKYLNMGESVAHMVYSVLLDGEVWVIDNIVPRTRKVEDRKDITPIFSFDLDAIYTFDSENQIRMLKNGEFAEWTRVKQLISRQFENNIFE